MPTAPSGTCLMCGSEHSLDSSSLRMPTHLVDTEQPGAVPEPTVAGMSPAWRCIGTGQRPVLDDGRDDHRRRAIENLSVMRDREQTLRDKLERGLSEHAMFSL